MLFRSVTMEGFGEKSYVNLMDSLERARETSLYRVIYGLGIPNVGLSNARLICKQFDAEVETLLEASSGDLSAIDGVGTVIADSFVEYFADAGRRERFYRLLKELHLKKEEVREEQTLAGRTFVITGTLERFANRSELKAFIEERGGKVTGSVTGKTDYLINNDLTSNSGKNKKARELGVPILSEEEFLKL